ncbi:hypothetical protein, partial [Anaerotignum sp.]|uniref:hypothetical protein n=1 Tax=Anaerotignum sp. TaxID=2039241 RepID=UPI00289B28E5
MSSIICNFQTLIRRFCINKINNFMNKRVVIQRKALGIYEETKDITQEQVIQSIVDKIISLSYKEAMEIEKNEELRKSSSSSINID